MSRIKRTSLGPSLAAVAAVVLLAAPAAFAQEAEGAAAAEFGIWTCEIYLGYLSPDDELLDEGLEYGGRCGYRLKKYGAQFQLGYFPSEIIDPGPDPVTIDANFTGLDLSVFYFVRAQSPSVFIFAGPGWAWADTDLGSADTLTYNGGFGLAYDLTDRTYLRPEIRGRYLDEGGLFDTEVTLSIGWVLGR